MGEMDCGDPIARAVEFLNSQKYNEAKAFLSEAAPDVIFAHGWDLVLPVLSAMEKEIDAKCDENVCLCKELLEVIGSRGKPKEVLISLLEHLQLVESSAGFHAVLQCFQKLLRSPLGNKLKFLDMILDSLYGHLKRLSASVAKNSGEQLSDGISTETPESQNLGCCLNAMAEFFSEVTRDCDLQKKSRLVECPRTENELFLRYLMLFLGEVAVLDLQNHDASPSFAHLSAERLVRHISSRSTDLIKLCISREEIRQCKEKSSDAEDTEKDLPEPVSPICWAVLAWLIFVENFEQDTVPCVYASRYIFEHNLQNIMILLSHSSGHIVVKGVALCANMVSRLNCGEFCCLDLDNNNLMSLLRCLGKVMIYSCSSKARKAALSVLVDYIKCFKYEAKYILYCRMLQVEKHAGLCGLLIDFYRQDMHATLKTNNIQDNTFLGVNFVEFLKIVVSNFSSRNLTDILGDSDSVLAVLNLLRYFASVMPHKGQIYAKTSQSVCEIAGSYTEQVKKSLDQTRIQYKAELEHNKEEVKGGKNPKDSLFPSLPPEQEAEVLKTALTRLDLVESVLVLAVDSLSHCADQLLQ